MKDNRLWQHQSFFLSVEERNFRYFTSASRKHKALFLGIAVALFFGVTVFFLLYGPRFSWVWVLISFFGCTAEGDDIFVVAGTAADKRDALPKMDWQKEEESPPPLFSSSLMAVFLCYLPPPWSTPVLLYSCHHHPCLSLYIYLALARVASVRASWVCASSFYLC